MKKIIFLLLIQCSCVFTAKKYAQTDIFCSTEQLRKAYKIEESIADILDENSEDLESSKALRFINIFVRDREDSIEYASTEDDVIGNPFHAFQILKRLVILVPQIENALKGEGNDLWKQINRLQSNITLSYDEDIVGAVLGLVRLHYTYLLEAKDVRNGILLGRETTAKLSVSDMVLLASVANNAIQGAEVFVADWAAQIEKQMPLIKAETDKESTKSILQSILEKGNIRRLYEECKNNKTKQHLDVIAKNFKPKLSNWDSNDLYREALCRGERFIDPKEERLLLCYLSSPHPFFQIQPVKTEVQSLDPKIVTVHDIVSKKTIKFMKKTASENMIRSKVVSGSEIKKETMGRISKTAWLKETKETTNLENRLGLYLGLSLDSSKIDSELFQVLNYGIGGQYTQHYDFIYDEKHKEQTYTNATHPGDRIATVLIYLTDVQLGGATAFFSSGIAVKPVMGSATYWYNLNPDGTSNKKTLHAGCPVLLGNKWVSNKWIREKGQMFLKPCPPKN